MGEIVPSIVPVSADFTRLRFGGFHALTSSSVVALTAGAMAEDQAACLEAGMDGFLAKPLKADDLLTALNKFLESKTPILKVMG